MKKIFAVVIVASALLSLLTGCIEVNVAVKQKEEPEREQVQKQESTEAAVLAGADISCTEVLDNLGKLLDPVADQFKMTLGRTIELDNGLSCQSVEVSYTITNERYDISIYYTKTGAVNMVALVSERGKYTDVSFALLSYYLYNSLNIQQMEADDFYEKFKLLTAEPDGYLFLDEWYVSATTIDTLLMFSVSYNPQ